MNFIHLHIILVHFPVVLVPVCAALLAIGFWKKNTIVTSVANGLLFFGSIVGVVAYFLGEEAEEGVEHLAGFSKNLIENHAEAGECALWFLVALGILAAINHLLNKTGSTLARTVTIITFLVAVFSSAVLIQTAQKGGMIRHPEAFTPAQLEAAEKEGAAHESHEHEEDEH